MKKREVVIAILAAIGLLWFLSSERARVAQKTESAPPTPSSVNLRVADLAGALAAASLENAMLIEAEVKYGIFKPIAGQAGMYARERRNLAKSLADFCEVLRAHPDQKPPEAKWFAARKALEGLAKSDSPEQLDQLPWPTDIRASLDRCHGLEVTMIAVMGGER